MSTTDYTHTTITLACTHAGGAHCSIAACIAETGLAYHLAHSADHNGPHWSVTHIKSGNALCGEATQFKNEAQCRWFITRITSFADWPTEKPDLSESMKAEIRRIAVDCQASYNYTPVF